MLKVIGFGRLILMSTKAVSGNYVPLDSRVKGACRCEKCSSNAFIRRWYENDFVCRWDKDGELCDREGKCYSKKRVFAGVRKGKAVYRVLTVKCPRCADGLK
jgi:hypothetical protein